MRKAVAVALRVALWAALFVSATVHADSFTDRALASHGAYDHAVRLADEIGARIAGSPAADRAVAWAERELSAMGLASVHTEPVTVTPWTRGKNDRVELVTPYAHTLHALALGGSPPTPAQGITADVIEVASFDELTKLGDKARGKIVFFDPIMKRSADFDEYGRAGIMRFRGAIAAAKAGAAAAVIRSVGTGSHRLPHTGATGYDDAVPQIPFAAVAAEDAMLLHRALARGPAQLKIMLDCGTHAPVQSANVIAEVRGRDKPDEVVVIGAHLDSWDVGDGALDDGAGVGIVMDTLRLIKDAHPRRTVRLVLFMNEEHGIDGAKAYGAAHAKDKHVVALEADAGAGAPIGLLVTGDDAARAFVAKLGEPVKKLLSADARTTTDTGADLFPLEQLGVPTVGVHQDVSDYFEWHHTDGDTADKIDPAAIGRMTAVFATVVLGLADAADTLPRITPPPPKR